jgi:DNA-binding transcriptional regulator/RsmH inhibitor MraZ
MQYLRIISVLFLLSIGYSSSIFGAEPEAPIRYWESRPSYRGSLDSKFLLKDEPVYFVMEKLDLWGRKKWASCAEQQEKLAKKAMKGKLESGGRFQEYSEAFFLGTLDALGLFRDVMRFQCESKKEGENFHEVWVVYVTNLDPRTYGGVPNQNQVEMAMTVSSSGGVPFVLHMGISRWISYMQESEATAPLHKDISTFLHGFAAKTMLMQDHTKRFLITTPLDTMRNILGSRLKKATFWVGHNKAGSILFDRPHQFSIRDPLKPESMWCFDMEAKKRHAWFFSFLCPDIFPYFTADLSALGELF